MPLGVGPKFSPFVGMLVAHLVCIRSVVALLELGRLWNKQFDHVNGQMSAKSLTVWLWDFIMSLGVAPKFSTFVGMVVAHLVCIGSIVLFFKWGFLRIIFYSHHSDDEVPCETANFC